MLIAFTCFIQVINSVQVPKFQYIKILNKGQEKYCDESSNDDILNGKDSLKLECAHNPNILGGQEMCDAVVDSYMINRCFYPEDGATFDTILSDIDNEVELLIIENYYVKSEQTIDFNQLKNKIDVIYIQHEYTTSSIQLKQKIDKTFDKTPKSIMKLFKENSIKKSKENGKLHLVGNINEKVSTLAIQGACIDIINEDLNIDTLIIENTEILSTTEHKIITNKFIQDITTTIDFTEYKNIIETQLFQVYESGSFLELKTINIILSNDHITINEVNDNNEEINSQIPYDFSKSIGLITIADKIQFKVDSASLDFPADFSINLTFKQFFPTTGPLPIIIWGETEDQYPDEYSIQFIKDSSWTSGLNKPKIIIDSTNKFNIDTTEIDEFATIIKNIDNNQPGNKPSDEQTTEPDDEETTEPVFVPDPSFKEDEFQEIDNKNPEQIKNEIKEMFEDNSKWTESKDHVIFIKNVQQLTTNHEFRDNEFILLPTKTYVNIEGKNLNLLIPNEDDEITITTKTPNEANVSVKGGGKLIIKQEDSVSTSTQFNLNSKMLLNSTFNVNVENEIINSIVIDSVSLFSSKGRSPIEIQANKDLNVKNLDARQYSYSSLSNININEMISVNQPVSLTLENVGIKDAKLLMNMNMESNNSEPLIQGNLIEIPKSFVINNVDGKPKDKTDYVLIKAVFNCNDWQSKLDFDKTAFNQKKCRESKNENAMLLEEKIEELVISKKSKKLSGGQIAGIVIGCVAAVAIIIIIIVAVIKCKKKELSTFESDHESVGL